MVFTRQKERAGENPESPARTQPGTNIREEGNPRLKVFTQEHNGLFIKRFVQYSQEDKGDELYYLVLGLNESSADNNTKTSIFPWLVVFNLTKSSFKMFWCDANDNQG